MSLSAYLAEQGRLLDQIEQEKATEGGCAVQALTDDLRRLDRDNPIPWERLSGALLEIASAELERRQSAANKRPRWLKWIRS
jgi:hypothetical protein